MCCGPEYAGPLEEPHALTDVLNERGIDASVFLCVYLRPNTRAKLGSQVKS